MNHLVTTTLFLMVIMGLSAQEMSTGIWLTGEENTKIETYEKQGVWYGKIKSSDNPKAKIGIDILKGFHLVDGKWEGQLYAAKRSKYFDAVIDPSNNVLHITVTAGLVKKKLTWSKEDED